MYLPRFRMCFFAALAVIVAPGVAVSQVQQHGLVIEDILKDSAAAKAGFALGDRILIYDGGPLRSPAALQAMEENTTGKLPALTIWVSSPGLAATWRRRKIISFAPSAFASD